VEELGVTGGSFWQRLMMLNLILVAFSLLPAFPMDGGRLLRALLAIRPGRRRATAIAANVGQAMAILFGIVGFFYNPLCETVDEMSSLKSAVESMRERQCATMPAVASGRMIGLLTLENISEMIMVNTAMDHQGAAHSLPPKLSTQNL
jgi:Peptidase family M50